MRVYKLYTTGKGDSAFEEGTITDAKKMVPDCFFMKEDPKDRRLYDWHPAPQRQYVITLRGSLEFTVTDGGTFILQPGDVLIADDVMSTGHKWKMLSEESWVRIYIVLKDNEPDGFVANTRIGQRAANKE